MSLLNEPIDLDKSPEEVLLALSDQEHIAAFDIDGWRMITFATTLIEPESWQEIPALNNSDSPDSPMPFISGYVGLIGYPSKGQSPKIIWGLCENTLGFDDASQQWHFYGSRLFLQEIIESITAFDPREASQPSAPQSSQSQFSFEKATFIQSVEQIKAEIKEGNVYQINLSGRLGPFQIENPIPIWHQLNTSNPATQAFYWQSPQCSIIGNSPELYLRFNNQQIESCPIKGTIPNPFHPQNYQTLWNSSKEESELTMIVDMVRNDLGRICQNGSIFTEGRKIRRCGDLLHTEQRIFGTLKESISQIEAIFSCFPAASITGAPKIAAMELIDKLEPIPRQWYTGSFGFLDIRGTGEWNVLIRSILIEKDIGYIHIGSGIVYDSNPNSEWHETLSKSKALTSQLI